MQKKLIAVAVAGVLGAPALAMAQSSTVQVYGRITFEYSYVDRGAGTEKGDVLQSPGGTSIGFKGEEKLGGGLSTWFQCESSADVLEGGDGFCTRNSALGFKGGFGNVFIGRWDTPFKRAHSLGSVGSESTGVQGNTALTVGNSTGRIGTAGREIWERRQAYTINYHSPKMSGFSVEGAYSSVQATGLAAGAAEPRVLSLGAQYGAGPLAIGLGWEKHQDAGGVGRDDDAWALSAKYKFGAVLVGVTYNKQNYDGTAAAPTANADRQAWSVGAEWNISGPHTIGGSYTDVGDMKGTAGYTPSANLPGAGPNTGAKQWQIAYGYDFSKRTEMRLAYVVTDNDSGTGVYRLNGITNNAATLGEKQTGFSLLMKHKF